MEQQCPLCVREAWDSAEEPRAPEVTPTLSSEDSGLWPLLFYPKLGHLAWDDQDFNRELFSGSCGLLRGNCRRHGPSIQNTSRQGAEPRDPDPTSKPQEPQTPSGKAAAAREARQCSPRRLSPPPVSRLPGQTPGNQRLRLALPQHRSRVRPPDVPKLAAVDLTRRGREDYRLPSCLWVPRVPRFPPMTLCDKCYYNNTSQWNNPVRTWPL